MNKKTKTFQKFGLLFLVITVAVGISIPQDQVYAGTLYNIYEILRHPAMTIVNSLQALVYGAGFLVLELVSIFVYIAAWLVDLFLSPAIYVGDPPNNIPGVLTSNSILIGWTVVRDICNMFFMFFLLLVAFGTMLRSKSINIKAVLPKIIISLFLINFSMVFAHLIIDISQFFMIEIADWMPGAFSMTSQSLSTIPEGIKFDLSIIAGNGAVDNQMIINLLFAIVFSTCLIFVYLMLACFLLIRLTYFAVLIVFSPVAFLGIAFPGLSKYSSQWWQEITKWAIFGPIFIFFVYLSTTMANELVGTVAIPMSPNIGFFSGIALMFIPAVVPIVILLMAPKFATTSGVAGASALVGGRGGLGNISMGAYGAGKWGAKKTKQAGGAVAARSQLVRNQLEKSKDFKSNALGAVGLHKQQSKYDSKREANKAEKLKEAKVDLVGTIDIKNADTSTLKNAAESKIGSNASSAVYLQHLAETNQLDTLSSKEKNDHMNRARPFLDKEEQEKIAHKDLEMATMTDKGQKRMTEMKSDPGSMSAEGQARVAALGGSKVSIAEEYQREQLEEVRQKGELKNLNIGKGAEADLTAKIMVEALPSKDLQSAMDGMSDKKKEKFQDALKNNADYAEERAAHFDSIGDTTKADENRKASDKFRAEAFNSGLSYTKANDIGGPNEISEERREKNFGNLDAKKVGKMSDTELAKDGYMANTAQSRIINREGKQEIIVKINDSKDIKISTFGSTGPYNAADTKKIAKLNKEKASNQSFIDGGQY